MGRIEDLYARYLRRLIRNLVGFGQSEADAEDVAQETLIATSKRLDEVAPEREWGYLKRAAFNRARNYARGAHAAQHGGGNVIPLDETHDARDRAPSAEEALVQSEEIARFRAHFAAAMAELSQDTRECVVLRSRGIESKEIAERLDLTDQAVRTRLSRASKVIRKHVGEPPADVRWVDLLGDDDDHED